MGLRDIVAGSVVVGFTTAGVGAKRLWDSYGFGNHGESFENFSELHEGWRVVDYWLPTRGDVVEIRKLDDVSYAVEHLSDGALELKGEFYYRIRPQERFGPLDVWHCDWNGNTPWNSDYWGDTREGRVILKKTD